MYKKISRILSCFIIAAMLFPVCCVKAAGDDNLSSDTSVPEEISEDDKEDYTYRTEKEVFSSMTKACENENMRLWYSENEDMLALENKKNGHIWWSSPINAGGDSNAKGTMKKELASSLIVVCGQPSDRTTMTFRSAKNGKMKYSVHENTLEVTYRFPAAGLKIPVKYTLDGDHLNAHIDTKEIDETKKDDENSIFLLEIAVLPNIMTESSTQNGYYIIPDGSGAVINFNNGRTNAREYSASVYGDDITAVSVNKPAVTEQIYLPVYAAVEDGGDGLLAVIHKGDSNAQLNANVSGMSKSSYNTCNSRFIVRSTDTYYMNNEPLTVFEKGDINTPELELKFYPLSEKDLSFADMAAAYRKYLTGEQGIKSVTNKMPLVIGIYGGVLKKEPVLGIPVTRKKCVTSFKQAMEITNLLSEKGTENIILSYDNLTDDGIENKVDTKAKPSLVLGSKKDFENMTKNFNENNISFYPVLNNKTFRSGNGYFSFSDTALRTSGQYSKQISYSLAYGTQDGMKKPQSLLSPAAFEDIFSDIAENYSKAGFDGICLGDMTSVLYGSYSKNTLSRNDAMQYIKNGLAENRSSIGSVLADTANAYAVGSVDFISGVPLSSSGFDIFDEDIPFYQLVMHGLIPYSTISVNGSADAEQTILMAAATGSSIYFDMVYEEISELKDTEYDIYFYADYHYWIDTAAGGYRFLRDVLSEVNDEFITDYTSDENTAHAVYGYGTDVKVDFNEKTASVNGKVYKLSDYID